jgi:GntR family transcriptional regulator
MAAIYPDPRPYMQIAAHIREHLTDGSLTPGTPIPTIADLRQQHGYSRATIGKGLRILENEGLLCRIRGLGYYVSSEALRPLVIPPRQPAKQDANQIP